MTEKSPMSSDIRLNPQQASTCEIVEHISFWKGHSMPSFSYRPISINETARMSNTPEGSSVAKSLFLAAVLLPFLLPCGVAAQQTNQTTAKIPDGTIVKIIITEDLNSGKAHQNDPVHGIIAEEVTIGGKVVIAKGAPVIGHVTKAKPKGRWGHSGSLAYTLDYAKAVDGSNVRLRASSSQGGEQNKGALMLGLSGAFVHGKNIDVKKGTSLSAYVDGDHTVTISPSTH